MNSKKLLRICITAILVLSVLAMFTAGASAEGGYCFITKWGSEGSGDGEFNSSRDIAVDSSGYVYVTDILNHRIQKFDSVGNFITKWGSWGDGEGEFGYPMGIAVDSSGYVYVTDLGICRIQKFDSVGNFITKWGSYGTGDGDVYSPCGIEVDSSGYVFVADTYNHRIQKFDSVGTFITKWGSRGTGDGEFDDPFDIAVDSSGYVYVADKDNYRIQKFDSVGNFITKWGSYGTGDGEFYHPLAIAVDSSGYVFVADNVNNKIQKFDSDGNFITKWGSLGTGDGEFHSPNGIAVDSSGYVYVADAGNERIQKFAPCGGTSVTILNITPSDTAPDPGDTITLSVSTRNDGDAGHADIGMSVIDPSGDVCDLQWKEGVDYAADQEITLEFSYTVPSETGWYGVISKSWDNCYGNCGDGQCCDPETCECSGMQGELQKENAFIVGVGLSFTQHAPPSSGVATGTPNVLVNTLDFTATSEVIKVDKINITLYGTGSSADLWDIKIYKETGGDGFYPVADLDISNSETADAWDGSVCTVTLGTGGSNVPQTIEEGDATWYIVFDIASTATDGHTVGGRIASGADISAKVGGETIVAQKEGDDPTELRTIIAPLPEPVPKIDSVEILDVNSIPTNIFTPGDKVNVKATISNPSQNRDYPVSVSMNIDDDTDGSNGVEYDSHEKVEDWNIVLPKDKQDSHSHTWSWVVPSQTEAEKTYHVAVGIHDQSNYDDICYDCPGYMWDFDAIVGAKKVLDVPYVTQGKAPWCLLASATMLLRYYGEDSDLWQNADWLDWNCDDGLLARIEVGEEICAGWIIQHPLLEGGDPDVPYNFQTGDWIIFASDEPKTFGWIKDKIDNNTPVIFFSLGILHAVVIVGYDDRGENIVYVNDPSGNLVQRSSVQIGGYDYGYPFIKKAVKWDKVLDIKVAFAKFPGKFIFIDSEESQKDPVVQLHLPFSGTGGCKIPYFPSDYVLPTYVDHLHFFEGPPSIWYREEAHLVINGEGLGWDFLSPDGLNPYYYPGDYLHFKEVHITNSGQGRNYKAVFSIGENEYETDPPFYLGTGLDKTFNEIKLKLWNLDSGDYIPRIEIYVEITEGTYSSEPIKTVSLPPLSIVPGYPFIATVFSPVDLTITDPDGFVINKESSEIPNANYIEVDIDGDGDLDDQIIIPQRKIGNYKITVTPEPDAEDTDTYTLEVTIGDTTIVLAEDVPISEIPDQPYVIESTETTINAAPVANSNGPYAGDEGSPITFDASGSYDPDGSIDLYEWDFDGDGVYDVSTATSTAIFTWGDDHAGTVELRVTDNDGLSDTDTATITVNNVAPTASFYVEQPEDFILPYHSLTFNGAFEDAGWLDTHAATWDFGDDTIVSGTLTPIGTTTAEHAYAEPGTYTVTLTVTDDDGGVGYHEEEVIVISAEEAAEIIIDQLEVSIVPAEAPKGVSQKIESAIAKLEQVVDFLDQGKYCNAIGKLDGMITQIEGVIDQVNEQRCSIKECKGKKCNCIADEGANELIESLEHAKEGAIAIRDLISAEHPECA